ncbi:MAG: YfhO family protein, partial [Candidatus Levybacteria bacterium]|nr:YfhO family protein [Candidatus Levybacteria bacterium]
VTRPNFIDGTNSPGNSFNTLWMEKGFKKDKEKIKLVWGKADIRKVSIDSTFYRFDVNANKDSRFIANVAYFPGWEVYVDNNLIKSNITKEGLISFDVKKGKHSLKIVFNHKLSAILGKILFFTVLLSVLFLFKMFYCAKIKK